MPAHPRDVPGRQDVAPAVRATIDRLRRGKTFFQPTTPTPGEYSGGYWLLKRDDPALFLGTDTGVVVYASVLPGGDFPEDKLKRPMRMSQQDRLRFRPFSRTETRRMVRWGAHVASALALPGREIAMMAYWHPVHEAHVVAGWDPVARRWVVE